MKKHIFILIFLSLAAAFPNPVKAQFYAVKVNTLGLATGTLNAGIEASVKDKLTVDLNLYFNPVNTPGLQCQLFMIQSGVRFWRYESYVGPFWGVGLTAAGYTYGDRARYYKGRMAGVGFSYGYSWLLSTRWSLTAEGGLGLCFMLDDKRARHIPPPQQDEELIYHYRRLVIAPSRLEIGFSYLF